MHFSRKISECWISAEKNGIFMQERVRSGNAMSIRAICVTRWKYFIGNTDIAAMEKAAEYLMGTHDFSAFTDLKEDKDTVRTIYAVGIVYEKDTLTLSWIGDGFLYHMVRILTGTLLDVGVGKIKAEEIPEILKAKDRKKSGFPAPAKGLFLGRVFYTEAELKKAVQKISEK